MTPRRIPRPRPAAVTARDRHAAAVELEQARDALRTAVRAGIATDHHRHRYLAADAAWDAVRAPADHRRTS